MSHLHCSGSEESLLQCNQRACHATGCFHSSRAGVICERKNKSCSSKMALIIHTTLASLSSLPFC